jgi:hypothetical protein
LAIVAGFDRISEFSEFRLLLLCDMKKKGDGKRPPDDSNAVRRVIDIESFSF